MAPLSDGLAAAVKPRRVQARLWERHRLLLSHAGAPGLQRHAGRYERQETMKVRIASDVGGTFTDSIAYDPVSRRIAVSKVPTTPQARDVGTVEGLRAALHQLDAT